jgi:3'-phosphoadenosine 5'-phosphosulfate sulfotransferase (PAPS reductase)/FAD synthetase
MTQRYFSFGGGVQSMAVLVLAVQGRVQYDAMLFCNVGHDSENPATIEYVERIAKPYAAANGVELVELRKTRFGQDETLLEKLYRDERSIGIPVYLGSGMPMPRNCTSKYKIELMARYHKQHGATEDNPCITGLGISMDEIQRMRLDSKIKWQTLEYPLIDMRLYRRDCMRIIADAGLPVPPKSSCWFCPFHGREDWRRLKREQPEQFAKAVELEHMLNERRVTLGRDRIYLHTSLQPLERAVGDQMAMDFPESDMPCDTGYCFI